MQSTYQPGYPFYTQPAYFNAHPPPAPAPPAAPYSYATSTPATYDLQPSQLPAVAKRRSKHRRPQTPSAPQQPLKSALKRNATVPASIPQAQQLYQQQQQLYQPYPTYPQPGVPIQASLARQRTISNPRRPQPAAKLPDPAPHVFLSLHGGNELRIDNLMEVGRDDVKTHVLNLWPPGVEADELQDYRWRVFLRNSPWSGRGTDALPAWNLVAQLFTLFSKRGFTYQASMNAGYALPRLVFQAAGEDPTSQFFIAYFSRSGHRVTLINPPPHVDIRVGVYLKSVFPQKIQSDRSKDNSSRIIDFQRSGFGAPETEKTRFLTNVLTAILDCGYALHATVPLPRNGPLGLGARRELFVFKGEQVTSPY